MKNQASARVALLLALSALPLALAAGCGDDDDGASVDTTTAGDADAAGDAADTTGGDTADTDATAPPSPISVRRTETEADLVTGPVPFGRLGRSYVLENGLVRFLVQDAGASAVYQLYGGSVVGADNARAPGLPGESVLRELFPVVDFRVHAPDTVTIVADGSDGERGILRLEGPLASSKIIAVLDAVAGTADLRVAVEYELGRGARDLIIRTIIENPTDEEVSVLAGDFMVASNLLQIFAYGPGFATGGTLGDTQWLAFRGEGVSYGYVYPATGVFSAPFVESSGTFAILDPALTIPAHGTRSLERRLLVGDGSLSDVVDRLYPAVGTPASPVSGAVHDPDGAAVAGAWVTALPITAAGAQGGAAVNQARTDATGAFAMTLPPGDYDLIASGTERKPSEPARVTVAADGAVTDVALTLTPPASVTVAVTTDMPAPTGGGSAPVKVALRALDEDANDTRLGDFGRRGGWRVEFVGPGYDTLTIAPGHYRVVLSRGPELAPVTLDDVLLEDGGTITAHLARA
ncbi:MAG: carboxypeptidase regulatory-like domain-containing protein, partial [Myxococcales bacterium]|nr:carboxypeptidase regulatory-like domain-containing protein [Myxococcales bacterium]